MESKGFGPWVTRGPTPSRSITQGNRDYSPNIDTLEAPILTLRGSVSVLW